MLSFRPLGWFAFALLLRADAPPVIRSVEVPGTDLQVNLATQVGRNFDADTVRKDVRYLWGLGRFDDIRVEERRDRDGVRLIFRLTPRRLMTLREVRLLPNTFGIEAKAPPEQALDAMGAHQIALEAQKQLQSRGYASATVTEEIVPVGHGRADLRLNVHAGESLRVREVRIDGDPAARAELKALKPIRILPGIPGLWDGWRLLPVYDREAVDADASRVLSAYLRKGYLDAEVQPLEPEIEGRRVRAALRAIPGEKYPVPENLCEVLLQDRREAQRQGIADFTARWHYRHGMSIELGRPYRVGRIEFVGNRRYSDGSLRRNFLLDEGDLFDERQLRRSLARLNRSRRFDPIDESNVMVQQDAKTGVANITVRVRERKGGAWNISGPVGPLSLSGPLQASIGSRLPGWGKGLLELSTYTASVSLFAFSAPVLPFLKAAPALTPVFAMARPFVAGDGWKSGFVISPQLGLRASAAAYALSQLQGRVMPRLTGERIEPVLPVTVTRPAGEAVMYCTPPGPRLGALRGAAGMALQVLGATSLGAL